MADYRIPSENSAFKAYTPRNIAVDVVRAFEMSQIEALRANLIFGVGDESGSEENEAVSDCRVLGLAVSVVAEEEEIPRKRAKSCLKIEGDVISQSRQLMEDKKKCKVQETLESMVPFGCVGCSSSSTPISSGFEVGSSSSNMGVENGYSTSSRLVSSSIQDRASSSNNAASNAEPNQRKLLFEKTLSPSDVGEFNRLVVPKKFAMAYLPTLKTNDDNYKKETLKFYDNQNMAWDMTFEFWPASQSYALTRGWKAFINHHGLQHSDVVCVYELELNPKIYGIDYRRHLRVPKTIRLFGEDYIYEYTSASNGDDGTQSNTGPRRRIRKGCRRGRSHQ